jgi:thiol-disulfide isomerase/thioredoxin
MMSAIQHRSSGVTMPTRRRVVSRFLLVCALCCPSAHRAPAAQAKDPVAQALAEGDLYESKRKYELALGAYRKADKLSHHNSSEALLKIARIEKKAGLLSDAANDAKQAVACAQGDKAAELRARLMRATLLTEMSGKPSDKKLKEAEAELRSSVALQPDLGVARFNLGVVLLKQERDAEGIAELKAFLENPGNDESMATEAKRMIANPIRGRAPFAPDFSFQSHDNQSVSNASLRGKVVLIDFWGTWCPPCRESVPILKEVQKKYNGKAFQLVSISSDDDEDVWKTFIQSQKMDWTEYLDSSSAVQESFKIDSFPTYIVMDKDGVIRFRQSGLSPMTQGDLEEAINKALKRSSDPALAKAASADSDSASEEAPALPTRTESAAKPPEASAPASTAPAERDSDAPSFAPPEGGQISGSVYTNRDLGIRFEFPTGWTAAKMEALHAANEEFISTARAALQKQHPEAAPNARILLPRAVFYASKHGDGNAQRATLSSIRIQALENGRLTEESFQMNAQRMVASDLLEVTPAAGFEVKGHKFIRAEFERKSGALHYYQGIAQTEAGDYLLIIEWFAASLDELHAIGDNLQKLEIRDDE